MEKSKKTIHYYMRIMHREFGYLIAGMTIIFVLSGIVQIYRDTDFLKSEQKKEVKIAPQLSTDELGKELKIKDIEVEKQDGNIVYFKDGTYNLQTGEAKYITKELPVLLQKFEELHQTRSKKSAVYIFTLIYAILLLFMVISSFWMYKPNTKTFKNGMISVGIGIILSALLLLML